MATLCSIHKVKRNECPEDTDCNSFSEFDVTPRLQDIDIMYGFASDAGIQKIPFNSLLHPDFHHSNLELTLQDNTDHEEFENIFTDKFENCFQSFHDEYFYKIRFVLQKDNMHKSFNRIKIKLPNIVNHYLSEFGLTIVTTTSANIIEGDNNG